MTNPTQESFNFTGLPTELQKRIFRQHMDNTLVLANGDNLTNTHHMSLYCLKAQGEALSTMLLDALFFKRTMHATLHGYISVQTPSRLRYRLQPRVGELIIPANICSWTKQSIDHDIFRENVQQLTLHLHVLPTFTPRQNAETILQFILSCPNLKILIIDQVSRHAEFESPSDRQKTDVIDVHYLNKALRERGCTIRIGLRADLKSPCRDVGTDTQAKDSLDELKFCGLPKMGCRRCYEYLIAERRTKSGM